MKVWPKKFLVIRPQSSDLAGAFNEKQNEQLIELNDAANRKADWLLQRVPKSTDWPIGWMVKRLLAVITCAIVVFCAATRHAKLIMFHTNATK